MKKFSFLSKLLLAVTLLFTVTSSFAQTLSDTVKTGKTNDPMVVDPGKANDSIAINPGKPNDPMAIMTDTGFINRNIMDNMMEIQLSKLGRDKATSPAVKKVARQMIIDHTAILNDLKKLATKNQRGSTESQMHTLRNLPSENLPEGTEFNSKWASAMLTMHEAKIDELEKFMLVTRDEGIKAAIGKALPKLRAHKELLAKIPGAKVTEDPNSVIH